MLLLVAVRDQSALVSDAEDQRFADGEPAECTVVLPVLALPEVSAMETTNTVGQPWKRLL
jgi:hypothetical protein